MKYLIGTSGWMYDSWKGKFYPDNISKKVWLEYYSKKFKTVEVNNSFYKLPTKDTFETWREKSAKNFLFSVKANRYITHMKKLSGHEDSLERFLNNITSLKQKLGPLLFQLPPFWHQNLDKLENFLEHLPVNHEIVFEFRHNSWYDNELYKLLDKYNIALCIHDHADGPTPEDIVTADFSYVRFHGPDGRYSTKYEGVQLKNWSKRIKKLNTDKTYCYFNNDNSGFAIENAKQLRKFFNSE